MKRMIAGIALALSLALLPIGQNAGAATCIYSTDYVQTAPCRYAQFHYRSCYNPPYAPTITLLYVTYGANC